MSDDRLVSFLSAEHVLHTRVLALAYLLLLAYHVSAVYFDLQTTIIGVSLCGTYDCEANPAARERMYSDGLPGWYHHNTTILVLEVCILMGILVFYVATPARPSFTYTLAQSLFLAALFYISVTAVLTSVTVAGNLSSILALVATLK